MGRELQLYIGLLGRSDTSPEKGHWKRHTYNLVKFIWYYIYSSFLKKHSQAECFKQQKCSISQFWKLEFKIKVSTSWLLWMLWERICFLSSRFWCWLAILPLWLVEASSWSVFILIWHPPCVLVCLQISSFLWRHQSYWIRNPPFSSVTSSELYLLEHIFQIRSYSKVLGSRTSTMWILVGHVSTHNTIYAILYQAFNIYLYIMKIRQYH